MVVVVAAALGAISLDPERDGARAKVDRTSTTSTAPTTTTTTRPRRGSLQPVTFAFGGDVHFESHLRRKLDVDPSGMFAPIAGELSAADVAMVNLEAAITEGGTPDPKSYSFRAPARALDALRVAGVDVVTVANNHGRDYGPVGLADTLTAKASGALPVVGVGNNAAEAYAPWRVEVRGQRIAVFGASDVIDDPLRSQWIATDTQAGIASAKAPEQERLLAAVRAERPGADTIAVYLHWGSEGTDCPTARQRELARALVDAGADLIVGGHTHRVMSAGRLPTTEGNAFVDYGLGNFVFYNESGPSGITGVLTVTATGRDVDAYAWKPARIRGGIPTPLTGDAAATDVAAFDQRRTCTDLTP